MEIDSDLTWKSHIHKIESKIASAIGIISKLRFKIHRKTAMLLYDTLILPIYPIAISLGHPLTKLHFKKLLILQKRSLRICYKTNNIPLTNSIFHTCSKLCITDINKLQVAKFVYSSLNKLLPRCFNTYFSNVLNVHSHYTRNAKQLYSHFACTNIRKFFITNSGPLIWNGIPDNIKSSLSLASFNKAYRNYLIARS